MLKTTIGTRCFVSNIKSTVYHRAKVIRSHERKMFTREINAGRNKLGFIAIRKKGFYIL